MLSDLKAPFSQMRVMAGKEKYNSAAVTGACHNFALEWLSLMFENSSPGEAAGRMAKLSRRHGGAAMVTQMVYTARSEQEQGFNGDAGVAAFRGLKCVRTIIPWDQYWSSRNLDGEIMDSGVSGMVYTFSMRRQGATQEDGAHSIAFFRRDLRNFAGQRVSADGRVFWFEPNYGEGESAEGELHSKVGRLIRSYGIPVRHTLRGFDLI